MSLIAVISEFHPFHYGHAYLLEEAKRLTGAEHTLSVMSGNFTQQGMPMYWDKLTRAAAACAGGTDLIFELPVLFATGSAGDFARGAVTLLEQLNCVDHLCFGVEDTEPEIFEKITDILMEEPLKYRIRLKEALEAGLSFPAAREDALLSILGEDAVPLLSRPNNILALEYLLALKKLSSGIRPIMIRRRGDYHGGNSGTFASATDIRNYISGHITEKISLPDGSMPAASRNITEQAGYALHHPEDTLSSLLAAAMLSTQPGLSPGELPMDMTPELFKRLTELGLPVSWEDALNALNTKNVTRGRACRALLHMLLGVTNRDRNIINGTNEPLYLNLLAARNESTFLLKEMIASAGCSIITKRSRFRPAEGSPAALLWKYDQKATGLYNQLIYQSFGIRKKDELRSSPVIV